VNSIKALYAHFCLHFDSFIERRVLIAAVAAESLSFDAATAVAAESLSCDAAKAVVPASRKRDAATVVLAENL
jgi:hypothetical protein